MIPSIFLKGAYLCPLNRLIKKKYLLILLLMFTLFSFSQSNSFKISGIIISNDDKLPLESATVYLERVKDSSLIAYSISNKDGKFQLEGKTYDDYLNLFVSYIGYTPNFQKIKIDKEEIDLNTITMESDLNVLGEVVIKSQVPIVFKKDTLEFNVKSFKTKINANIEDLLKKLPGVEVDAKGKIKVNGIDVNKILVNGKPFFGNDPTITTRNLPKDIINKVQVTDTKTKSEAFAGEKGDQENKTINLTISEEKNKGVFGQLSAGGSADENYEFAGLINVFDNNRRISLLTSGNNTNSPGFSFGEIQKMFGAEDSFGEGQGIVTSKNIGINYVDQISTGIDVSMDYFYSESDTGNESNIERESILPNTRFFTNSNSNSMNDTKSHNLDTTIDIELDSTFLINIQPSLLYGSSQQINNIFEQSFDNNYDLTNQSTANSFSKSKVFNFDNALFATKRIGSRGGFLKFIFEVEFNSNYRDEFLSSDTRFQDPNNNDLIRDQFIRGKKNFNLVRTSATYRLPLIMKELFLDIKFNHISENRNSVNSSFDYNNLTESYDIFNSELSSDFKYINVLSSPRAEILYNREKWSASLEGGYLFRTIENSDKLRPQSNSKKDFETVELRTNFNYRFSDKSFIYSGYSYANNPPDIKQLQTFQDVSNPLNTITGNSNLKPSSNHNFHINYNNFNLQNDTRINVNFNAGFINDQIVTRSSIDENFIRNTTYDNVSGNYSIGLNSSYSNQIKLDSLKKIKFNIGWKINQSKNINFNNGTKYASKNRIIQPYIDFTFDWKNILEFRPNYAILITDNSFDLEGFNKNKFIQHNLGIRTTSYFRKKFEWRNDISFTYNSNVASRFQKSAWFWNSTLSYSFMKDQSTLTLKAFDILRQNTNAIRIAKRDYIQDSQSILLQPYFMLSFSWKFNSLGKKGENNKNDFFFF